MGRINAGADFGNAVAQPTDFSSVATPRAAFGTTETAQQAGQQLEAEGRQQAVAEARDLEQMRQEGEQATALRMRQRQQEVNQQYAEQVRARERSEAAVAQAKLYTLRDKLGDAIVEIDRGVMDGSIPKTEAASRWAERSKELIDADMDGIPDAHKEFVRIDVSGVAERLSSKIGDTIRRKDQTDTRAALEQTLEHTERLAQRDPAAARAVTFRTLEELGPAAGLNAAEIGKVKQAWTEKTAYTSMFSAVHSAKGNNAALASVEKALTSNQDIDPQKKAGLFAQIENYRAANEARALRAAQHAEIVAARVQRESDSAFNTLSAWALAGKAANPEANSALIAKLTPQAAAAYKAMAAEIPARTVAAMLPLDVQQQQLDALMATRNAQGTSQPLEQEIKRREDVLAQARKDYQNDPLRAAQERGVLDKPIAPLDLSSLDAAALGLVDRVQQAATVSTRLGGRPVSPLLPEEAGRIGDVLNALPPAQRAGRIAQLAGVLPAPQMQALAAQINEKDRGLALEFATGASKTTQGRFTSELIARGRQAQKDRKVSPGAAGDATERALRENVQRYIGDALVGQAREDIIDAAMLISHGLEAVGSKGGADRAVRLALGGDFVEHNGRRIPVPAGFDAPALKKALQQVPAAAIRQQAGGDTVFVGGQPLPLGDFMSMLPDAVLAPAGQGRYTVIAGDRPVTDARRKPIIVQVQ